MIYELITVFARSADRRVVPESWSASLFDPKGLLLSAARAKVKEIVQDAPPDDSLFDLVFPEGTMVDDIRPHADGGTGHRRFIVVQGKERIVTDEEIFRDATYEELVRTKSGQAALELPVRPWFNWILAINVIVVVVLSCAVFIRRRKSAAHGL